MAKSIERANYVRKQRQERAWTQSQLAEVADVDLRTIQRLEKDGAASPETLMAVAQAFSVDVKELSPALNDKDQAVTQNRVHLLPRLVLGRDLVHVIIGAERFQIEHDDDDDQRSVNAMKGILDMLKQDVVRLHDASPSERLTIESELSQELSGLDSYGYYLFGIRRVIPRFVSGQVELVSLATIYMSHSRSPKIVRDKEILVVPAVLTEVANQIDTDSGKKFKATND